MIDYNKELNEGQRAAVLHQDGPAMVIAGAGSGKTRVLTYRIAHLLEKGVEPWQILALTFTNKAAGEMKERIGLKVGLELARGLWMGTFHSVFSRILHAEAAGIGFSSNFTVYDQADSLSLIRSIVKEMQLDDKIYKPSTVQNRISNAKNRLVTPDAYLQNADIYKNDQAKRMPMCGQIYQKYWSRLHQADAMDFDDLLMYTYLLFQRNPEILAKYSSKFRYVLVDEYQDTNYAQHCIVWQLTREHRQLCVVGDDAQSIYSFRGANIDNMLKFTKLYPEAMVYKLEQNYRSTQNIVAAANSLIDKNREQIKKNVFSDNEKGAPIKVIRAHTDLEEGELVAKNVLRLSMEGVGLGKMAILYRTNVQSRVLEETMRRNGISYKVYGSLSFYQRKEIKDLIAYFRLTVNHNDEEAFKRIINYPARGIGQTTLGRIEQAASDSGVSLWHVITHLPEYSLGFNQGCTSRLQQFAALIDSFTEAALTGDALQVARLVTESSGLMNDLKSDHTPEGMERLDNVLELMNGVEAFVRGGEEEGSEHLQLTDYLNEVVLLTDQDNDKEGDADKITLMTVHAAKGLEFNTVFVTGMEENLFPSQMSMENDRQIEEERRLFYVAITRAEKHCFLLFAACRHKYGNVDFAEPSRFLKDIDPQFLDQTDAFKPQFRYHQEDLSFDDEFPFDPDGEPRFVSRESIGRTQFRSNGQGQSAGSFRSVGSNDSGRPSFNSRFTGKDNSAQREFSGKPSGSASSFTERKSSVIPLESERPKRLVKVTDELLSRPSDHPVTQLAVGNVIAHERFGVGEVLSVEGSGESSKAHIRFRAVGEKTLLLKFARFTIVS